MDALKRPGLKALSWGDHIQEPEGVKFHDILYIMFRDILYSCGFSGGWESWHPAHSTEKVERMGHLALTLINHRTSVAKNTKAPRLQRACLNGFKTRAHRLSPH